MMGLSDGERILMMRSAVLVQIMRVTDGQTNGQTELGWHIHAVVISIEQLIRMQKIAAYVCFI